MAVDSEALAIADGAMLETAYRARVAAGEFDKDAAQLALVRKLDKLLLDLEDTRLASKQSALGWLFSRRQAVTTRRRGLYIWGPVGRGKTILMDMFYDHAFGIAKRRAHFHDFMLDVHDRIHSHREKLKQGKTSENDPVPPVARALADEAMLLCFDEFSVTDVADAMILSRLFTELFANGVMVIATSNVAPDALYADGLNRQFFLSFVALLKENVEIHHLDARIDFRLEKLARSEVYIVDTEARGRQALDRIWRQLTGTEQGGLEMLQVKGRELIVPESAPRCGALLL